jgi:cytidylate kinase
MPGPGSAPPRLVVALDGPASSGKSSVGAAAAQRLGYRFLDTGLLYRALTYLALTLGHGPADVAPLLAALERIELVADDDGRYLRVRLDGRDVTDEVHSPRVDRRVSEFSAIREIRGALVPRQRELAAAGGIVMAGRDIGTAILPDADLKLYLDASAEERARRRARERRLEPGGKEAQAILADLRRRDAADSGRSVAPLRPADDARILRTDGNTREQTIELVVEAIREAEAARAREDREASPA